MQTPLTYYLTYLWPTLKSIVIHFTNLQNSLIVLAVQERGEGCQARRGQGKQIQGQRGEENDGGNESVVIVI